MNVLVVVLNFKGWEDTIECLKSLEKQTYNDFTIYLIENGSGDSSDKKLAPIAQKNKQIIYQKNAKNLGFTGGVNQGISYAIDNTFDAVALLNNDAKTDKNWLKNLVGAMKKTDASIVTGLLLSSDGQTIDDAGDFYTMWGVPALRAENEPAENAPESGFVFGATGGATLYKTDLFREIGLFDDVFFAYNEDVDIDWRAQLAGHTVYYEKSAVAYHKHSATSKKIPGFTTTQVFQNLPIVFWKNVPARLLWPIGWRFFIAYSLFYWFKVSQGGFVPATKGFFRSVKLCPHALRQRKSIQKNKKVDAKYLREIIWPKLPFKNIQRLKHPLKSLRKNA
jgi:GT2 family glycosyltransferase